MAQTNQNYQPETFIIRGSQKSADVSPVHKLRIKRELKQLGLSGFGQFSTESRYLPRIIHPDENIGGVLYGKHKDGLAMLVATDRRVIFLDKKPLFIQEDDITFYVVSGVTYTHAGFGSTVTLHTRIKDYTIRTLNRKTAEKFVTFIEERCLEHKENKEYDDDYTTKSWVL